MSGAWVETAKQRLLALRERAGGWGYRAGRAEATEATALGGLALLAHGPDDEGREAVERAAGRLERIQQGDGSLGVTAAQPRPGWATTHGLWLWSALGGRDEARRRGREWLLEQKGKVASAEADAVAGHDGSIVGWSWVEGTHSWLEPTAMAVLALRREGLGDHARVREGRRLVLDRAIPTGGWNYGNSEVLGQALRPQPAPTGLALLALTGIGANPVVERGLDYLARELPMVRSATSLGWGLLALRAWGRPAAEADAWLDETCRGVIERPDAAPRLAVALLAAGPRTFEVLGLPPRKEAAA